MRPLNLVGLTLGSLYCFNQPEANAQEFARLFQLRHLCAPALAIDCVHQRFMMIFTSPYQIDIPFVDVLTLLFSSTKFQANDPIWIDPSDPSVLVTLYRARELTQRIGHSLRDLGVGHNAPGKDIVITFVENQVLIAPTIYGILCAEGICATCPPTATAFELARQILASSPRLLICSPQTRPIAEEALRLSEKDVTLWLMDSPSLTLINPLTNTTTLSSAMLPITSITDRHTLTNRTALLIYSSGTTGLPKGVRLSHYNFVANILQISHHFAPRYARIRSEGRCPAMAVVLPNSNAAGVILHSMLPLYIGWQVYPMPKYDLPLLMQHVKRFDLSVLFLTPAIWQRILNEYTSEDVRSVRFAMSGGSILPVALQKRVSDMFAPGINLIANWGMTEATCEATQFALDEVDEEASVGRLMPNMSAIVIDENGKVLGAEEMGEMCIKGPNVTKGYFGNEEATRSAFTEGGFFKTGDIAVVGESGKVWIRGRYKELIKYKGNQVPPVELESVISEIPGVKDVGVIGVPRGDGNELPRAYVVKESSDTCNEERISEYVKPRLANHKWLRGGVRFVDEIPRNTIGKIDRKILKTWCEEEMKSERQIPATPKL